MGEFFDGLSRRAGEARSRREALLVVIGALLGTTACWPTYPTDDDTGGGGGGGGSTCQCNRGDTYNYASRKCCDSTYPYYYPGTHGGQPGCYQRCPYVGDCGTQWTAC